MDERPLMVTIRCLCYNHEPYIRQCLEGFVMQKTSFRFEAIVHDDASTDRSADIIREYARNYPDIIKPIYESENQYSKHDGSLSRIVNEACKGKYIALCEGDDYWIDPFKLQKQVGFLEDHVDYGLVYSNHFVLSPRGLMKEYRCGKCSFEELLTLNNEVSALTTCFRRELFNRYMTDVHPEKQNWLMGDLPIWIYMSFHTKIKFIKDFCAVYRILPESASHSRDVEKTVKFVVNSSDIRIQMLNKLAPNHPEYKRLLDLIVVNQKIVPIMKIYSKNGFYHSARNIYDDCKSDLSLMVRLKCFLYIMYGMARSKIGSVGIQIIKGV